MKLIKCTPLLRTHCKIKGRLVTQLLVAAGQAGAWSHGHLLHGMAADGGLEGLGTAPPGGFSQGGDTGCWYPVAMLPWRDPCLCRPPEVCLAMPPEFCPAMLDLVPMLLEDVCRATPA